MNDLVRCRPHDGSAGVACAIRRLTILYGTETGNSHEVAKQIAQTATSRGLASSLLDLSDYEAETLGLEEDVLVVVSTSGEGDPPQSAEPFFRFLDGEAAPQLNAMRYAVLALGDTAYDHFCAAGKRLDRRLEELGGTRLLERVDCDIDYEEPAEVWLSSVMDLLDAGVAAPAAHVPDDFDAPTVKPGYDKRHPLPATIARNIPLVGKGSTKSTRHVEFSLAGSGLEYQPGDALGLIAANDPALVATLLAALELSPNAPVAVHGQQLRLHDALEQHFEITTATPRFLAYWAAATGSEFLHMLLSEERTHARAEFLHSHHVIDIVRHFPADGVRADNLAGGLRPLQPRLYSIASSLAATPDAAHLTVAPVEYALHGTLRRGVATSQLALRGEAGTTMQVYVHHNPHFRLPDDDTPIILIGAGTGVAPYRGFLQERQARGATGKSFLFFGERNRETDFLYRAEWEAFIGTGTLTDMEAAFSRDGSARIYVQHRMLGRARDVYRWLEEGAHIYVCGDAANMAPDVHAALIQIVAGQQGCSGDAAEDYVAALQSSHRYHRDVY